MHKLKFLKINHNEVPLDVEEREVSLAKKRMEDYNLSISGDVSISDENESYSKKSDDGYDYFSEIILSAQCENDGWEEGYDY